MRTSRLLDALVILSLLAAVALGIFMRLGKSVQARVGAATQKMVGSISHDAMLAAYRAAQAVSWSNRDKFSGFDLLAFDARPDLPISIYDQGNQYFADPKSVRFFLLDKAKLKSGEHYRTLRDTDPRLAAVSVEPGLSGGDWAALTLEKRPDGSFVLNGPPKPQHQAAPQPNAKGGAKP